MNPLGILCRWFSTGKKFFNLSLGSDNVEGIDSIMEKADTEISNKMKVSLNEREHEIINYT